jgi:hypothetical protein
LEDRAPAWVLVSVALALAAFVWLLNLHPTAVGRMPSACRRRGHGDHHVRATGANAAPLPGRGRAS